MAKMFYTSEEAASVLSCKEDALKQYAREGRLREFRDGPRLMYKADQIENLRLERAGGQDTFSSKIEGTYLGQPQNGIGIDLHEDNNKELGTLTLSTLSGKRKTITGAACPDETWANDFWIANGKLENDDLIEAMRSFADIVQKALSQDDKVAALAALEGIRLCSVAQLERNLKNKAELRDLGTQLVNIGTHIQRGL